MTSILATLTLALLAAINAPSGPYVFVYGFVYDGASADVSAGINGARIVDLETGDDVGTSGPTQLGGNGYFTGVITTGEPHALTANVDGRICSTVRLNVPDADVVEPQRIAIHCFAVHKIYLPEVKR